MRSPVEQQEPELTPRDGEALLDLTQASIRHGLQEGRPLLPEMTRLPGALRRTSATFVTLRLGTKLRGCIGSIEAKRPLAEDVARNAFNAAFHDPRFPPLRPDEYRGLNIQLSILSDLETVDFTSEAELLSRIRKDEDGLLLELGSHRGLLLPSVWTDLPEKEQFLLHLKRKAGLKPDYWSNHLSIHRFTTQTFARLETESEKRKDDV